MEDLDIIKSDLIFIIENSENQDHVSKAEEFLLEVEETEDLVPGINSFIDEAKLEIIPNS